MESWYADGGSNAWYDDGTNWAAYGGVFSPTDAHDTNGANWAEHRSRAEPIVTSASSARVERGPRSM